MSRGVEREGFKGNKRAGIVTPEDVIALIQPVLAHRLVLAPEAIAGGATAEQLLAEATRGVPVPQG